MRIVCRSVVVAVAVLLSGCGVETSSQSDYARQLDGLCAAQRDFVRTLPDLQRREASSIEQVRRRAEERAADFRSSVASLRPPLASAQDHQSLIATLDAAPSGPEAGPAELRPYLESLGKIYARLGARQCEQFGQEAIAGLSGR